MFQKFELSLKNSENFDAKEFLEMPLREFRVAVFNRSLQSGKKDGIPNLHRIEGYPVVFQTLTIRNGKVTLEKKQRVGL